MGGRPRVRAKRSKSWTETGGKEDHAAAAGRNEGHVGPVVDVRRAYFHAEPLPKTFVELADCHDLDIRTRCCGRLRRCLKRDEPDRKVAAT